ncbi:hypothetical protein RNZ50_08500 [Paracoccaceae bacterium Fryx2]|nr:hypothetical protein [Paracoccaceae bacterium Fryx2]
MFKGQNQAILTSDRRPLGECRWKNEEEMNTKLAILALIAGSIATGCSPRADAVSAVSMTGAYDHLTCSQARNDLASQRVNLASLEKKQNGAATGDAIGVFLVLIPVSKLTGGDVAGELAASKGKVIALEQRVARCK